MNLEEQIMSQLKQAMRDKNQAALRTLRAIKSAILIEKTSVAGKDHLTKEEELKLLQKMVKQRKDSLSIYEQQNRTDLAAKEIEEIEVLNGFLPQQLSEEEIEIKLKDIIKSVGASSIADLGKVMASATKALSGQAEGKVISDTAKRLLS